MNEEEIIKDIIKGMKRRAYGLGGEDAGNELADCKWGDIEDALRTLATALHGPGRCQFWCGAGKCAQTNSYVCARSEKP